MMGDNQFFEPGQAAGGSFQDQQNLSAALDFSLPPIMGFNVRNQIGAGDEAGLEGGASEAAGGSQVRRGDERDPKVRGFHAE